MKLFLTDQSHRFDKYLKELIGRPAMNGDLRTLKEKVSSIEIASSKRVKELNLDFLFAYRIFPPEIMSFKTQWETNNRSMKFGDTILQQVFIPPTRTFSQKIIFGVRINSIINEPGRKGFSYVTIEGHVEKGESIFTVEETSSGIVFKIQTFSTPGNFLSKLLGSVFSLPYQRYCTGKALAHVKGQIENNQAGKLSDS